MSRTMIAALTLVAVAACGGGDKGDTATADSLSRDLQLAPVDTTAALNDRPGASTPAPAPRNPARTNRPATPSQPSPSAPAASPRSLAPGTTIMASTNAEIRSHKNKVGDTVTATVASDIKDRAGRVVIPAGSEVGAVVGRVLGGSTKGAIIGGVLGGAVGAQRAVETKDRDVVLPQGTTVVLVLDQPFKPQS